MKSLLVCIFLQVSIMAAIAQEYRPTDQGSAVSFKIKNLGFNVDGKFTGLQGKIVFDPKAPASGSIDVSVDAASVNTDNDQRDNHLKKEDYFDVANHPRIRFVSTGITGKDWKYTVTGKLTIKSTTKEISFPFTATPKDNDMLFAGEFSINRKDYGVGGTSTLSSSVTIALSVLGKK